MRFLNTTRIGGFARVLSSAATSAVAVLLATAPLLFLPLAAPQADSSPRLLFKSGFEPPVSLDTTFDHSYQHLRGSDQPSGPGWPLDLFKPHPRLTGIQNVISRDQSNHVANAIETVPGPHGVLTKALLLKVTSPAKEQTCCIQASLQSAAFADDVTDIYVRYWTKLNPEFLDQARALTTSFWRMSWEIKTLTDYRITPMIYADASGTPYWFIKADNNPSGCTQCQTFWSITNKVVPVPLDRWYVMEFYVHRSTGDDGRVFWGVDGLTIADHWGPNYGSKNEKVDAIMYKNVYGNAILFPIYEWIDDFEIWNAPPCANLPCGLARSEDALPAPHPLNRRVPRDFDIRNRTNAIR